MSEEITPEVTPEPTPDAPVSWVESLPEDIRGNDTLKAFKDPGELAKAHLDTLASIPKPPESADAYAVDLPEGAPVDEPFLAGFKTAAHASGMTQEQVAGVAKWYSDFAAAQMAEYAKQDAAAVESLKSEWKGDYQANLEVANRAMRQFCNEADAKYLADMGLASNPVMVKLFHKVGKAISEDTLIEGKPDAGQPKSLAELMYGKR